TGILDRAKSEHFETDRLEYTPQPPADERNELNTPVGDVPTPPHAGCTVAPSVAGSARATGPGLWLAAVGLAIALRRRRARR
ncbi:MAG TPA: hypothetical protein VGJ91_11625, partial [Polyangiaceae bacterium]